MPSAPRSSLSSLSSFWLALLAVVPAGCGSSPRSPTDDLPDAAILDGGPGPGGSDAMTWTPAGPGRPDRVFISSLWGASATDLWLTGKVDSFARTDAINVMHWDGVAYRESRIDAATARRVFALDADHVWAVGDTGAIAVWDAASTRFKQLSATTQNDTALSGTYADLWGTAADDLWAVGGTTLSKARLIHWDGRAWAVADADLTTSVALGAIWGTSADDIWAIGDGVFHKAAGTRWDKVALDVPASALLEGDVCGTSPDDVWVVGDRSTVQHKQGATWTAVAIGAPALTHLHSCWAAGNQVWIAGDLIGGALGGGGVVFHFDGARWWQDPSFRSANPRFDGFPVVTLGQVGGEVWVTDQRGVLYKPR